MLKSSLDEVNILFARINRKNKKFDWKCYRNTRQLTVSSEVEQNVLHVFKF